MKGDGCFLVCFNVIGDPFNFPSQFSRRASVKRGEADMRLPSGETSSRFCGAIRAATTRVSVSGTTIIKVSPGPTTPEQPSKIISISIFYKIICFKFSSYLNNDDLVSIVALFVAYAVRVFPDW